jgi:hypothetical protein
MSDQNIFSWEYRENNYISKDEIIVKLNEFIYKEGSYKKFRKWHDKYYEEEYYEPSKKELLELIKFLVNSDWKYILDCNNPSFENYVNDDEILEFDNPNCKCILRVDNDKNILENVLCELFTCCDDLYVIYKKKFLEDRIKN